MPVDDSRRYRVSRGRLLLIASAVAFFATFVATYRAFAVPIFEYFGLGFNDDLGVEYWILIVVLALAPAAWLPTTLKRPSTFLLIVQYFIVYVPGLLLAFHGAKPRLDEATSVTLACTLFAGLTVMQAGQRFLPVVDISRPAKSSVVFWSILIGFGVICVTYLVAVLGANFKLVSFSDVYIVRQAAAEALGETGSRYGIYAFTWLNGVVLPILFATGVVTRRPLLYAGCAAVYVFLFGIWGGKTSLITPFVLGGLAVTLRGSPQTWVARLAVCLTALLLLPLLAVGDAPLTEFVRSWLIALIQQRTFSSSALLITQYLDFFTTHPLTLGSHITGINQLVEYPYDGDIPRTIGSYFYGHPMTANANFWAMDGIAGFGLPGIVAMSALCAIVLWLFDCACFGMDARFVVIALGYMGTNFADVSLFTNLVTGGLVLLTLFLWAMPTGLRQRAGS